MKTIYKKKTIKIPLKNCICFLIYIVFNQIQGDAKGALGIFKTKLYINK